MSIWKPAGIDIEPQIILTHWKIVEAEFEEGPPSRHFVGYDHSGRVSSSIQEFDPKTLKGKTRSGRVYQLVGRPGYDSDAAYVWNHWAKFNKVTCWKDVSNETLSETAPTVEEKSEPTL